MAKEALFMGAIMDPHRATRKLRLPEIQDHTTLGRRPIYG
jgi:hypothetical protein